MKIYNKKTFMSGVFLIVLGVPTLIINILEKDVDVNIVIWVQLCDTKYIM